MSNAYVLRLDDDAADLATAGGKGASLARLAAAGLPVPPGFHITTHAFRAYRDSPDEVVASIRAAYQGGPVAVRSSATAEDLPDMSFAGQHDSFLNITGFDALLAAVRRCWDSLWTERAIAYRAEHGVSSDVAMAVVVQELVPADAAGVLFTADPLTGNRDQLVINANWGLGETVVSGLVTPDVYVVDKGGSLVSSAIHEKTAMTVRTPEGTRAEPVPDDRRGAPVLTADQAVELARLGERIEVLYGVPMDIEWAVADESPYIVQARPITNLPVARAEWNDTRLGDYLWTNGNVSEAVPSVMTPVTWSVIQALAMPAIGGHPTSGNIGGRFYLNLSTTMAMANAFGMGKAVRQASEQTFGHIPADVPRLPMSWFKLVRAALPVALLFVRQGRAYRRHLPRLLASNPARCASLRDRIAACTSTDSLLALWRSDVDSLLRVDCQTLDVGARQVGAAKLGPALRDLVGEADANTLLTGAGADLASLGPLIGLAQLKRGSLTRDAYVRDWGHRCPDEYELSAPRPGEDPAWIDRQRDAFDGSPEELLSRQASARAEAWARLEQRFPGKAAKIKAQLAKAATTALAREQSRSEMVRTFWVFRAFVLRAGALTGHGDDLFFLGVNEILALLAGDTGALASVPGRRAAYDHYRSLPPYPPLIRGRFDPSALLPPADGDIRGFPGVGGVVTGTARVVSTVEDAQALRQGEILVTVVTNIGWTPLFPRAAAVVTDVGAPLSHAAIVARELGIPAVVGCGNATARISTGDQVRVDGGRGTVTVL
ncbi:PEP/pyruvate-binding domain-containing protein [Actinocrispum wychmicini]|uniref:Pyruvate,water dikinase n=1 Tax=Actinocrispum wychmicini TaxID=1213861 RepID=A0A4R2JQ66_9PSEU|nr:PEP/pyruvate-binding domain-containing protein [Actinocrispum wychmicini]TCO62361.1 pyruvate,water dikinase [Actinocrispum wychmicini]